MVIDAFRELAGYRMVFQDVARNFGFARVLCNSEISCPLQA